ncbi:MAG: class I SAM-dependent methyltransferase [Chloroflexi bacterium]|nr:class I SAM-dependent methyltransferase [Chloroflexota bacterium]
MGSREPLHRADLGWRNHSLFGAVGFRPAIAQHSVAEAELIQRWADGRSRLVEIGVAEGGSAWDARLTMSRSGTLTLIDTYPKVAGVNLSSITARRLVGSVDRGTVEWIRSTSVEAATKWDEEIDFLLIDGDHSYEATRQDFADWSPFVGDDGVILFHDALVGSAEWMNHEFGSSQFVKELLQAETEWALIDQADSMAVFRRVSL